MIRYLVGAAALLVLGSATAFGDIECPVKIRGKEAKLFLSFQTVRGKTHAVGGIERIGSQEIPLSCNAKAGGWYQCSDESSIQYGIYRDLKDQTQVSACQLGEFDPDCVQCTEN